MPLDNLSGLLDGLVTTDAGSMPPAFSRRVTRRRWMRRATLGGGPVVAFIACLAAVVLLNPPAPTPDPAPRPTPHPTPIAQEPAPKVFGDTSFAALSRAGLLAPVLQDVPTPRTGQTFAPVRTEPPLRAFEVARVLRGL